MREKNNPCYIRKCNDFKLSVFLCNFVLFFRPRDDDGTIVLSYGEDKVVIVDVKLDNKGEPAYETKLYVTVPASFEWNQLDVIYPVSLTVLSYL